MSYPLVPLGQIVKIARDSIAPEAIVSGTTYVGLENITGDGKFSSVGTVDVGDLASSKFSFTPKHILYGKLRPYLRKIARPSFSGICSTDILPILPGSSVDRDYLAHFLRLDSSIAFAESRSVGVNLPRINPSVLATLEVPLPLLEEQRRIAAILDKADDLRHKRRAAFQKLDSLTQSLFIDMFGDPATNPKGWKRVQLEDICDRLTDGTHFSPPIQKCGVPYITAKHLKPGGLDFFSDPWFVAQEDHDDIYRRCDPRPGDVLYIKDGATTGVAAINKYEFPFSMLSSLALLRPSPQSCLPEYLCAYLNDQRVKQIMLGDMAGAAIRRLTLEKLRRAQVLLPPITLQRKFSKLLMMLHRSRMQTDASLIRIIQVLASLQHRAFNGEL